MNRLFSIILFITVFLQISLYSIDNNNQTAPGAGIVPEKTSLTSESRIADGYVFGKTKSVETKKIPNPDYFKIKQYQDPEFLSKKNQEPEITVQIVNLTLDSGQAKSVDFGAGVFISDGKALTDANNIKMDTEIALANNGKVFIGYDAYKLRQQQKSNSASNGPVLPTAVIGKVETVKKNSEGGKFIIRFDSGKKQEYTFGSLEIVKNGKPAKSIIDLTPGGAAIITTENGKDKLYLGSDAMRLIRVYEMYKQPKK